MTKRGLVASLLPLPTAVGAEADQLGAVASAIVRGDVEAGRCLLERVNRDALRVYYDSAGWVWQARHRPEAHQTRVKVAAHGIPKAVNLEVAARDRWRCRYCGVRLISFDFSKRLHNLFPDLWVIDPGVERLMHPAAYLLRYTPDHVVPRSAGGANDASNLVACCGTCQYQKGDCSIEELGLSNPFDRLPIPDGWDGLSGRFGPVQF